MSNIEYALNGGLSFQPVACKAKSFWKKGWDLKKCFFNGSPSPTKSCGTSSQHYNTPRSSLSSLVSCSGHAPWVSYHCTFPQYVLFMEVFFLLLLTPTWHIALLIEILFFKVFSISLAQTSLWAPPCAIVWPLWWCHFPLSPSLGIFFVFYL